MNNGAEAEARDGQAELPGWFHPLAEPLPERIRPRRRGGRGMRWRRRLEPPYRLREIFYNRGGFPARECYEECRLRSNLLDLMERYSGAENDDNEADTECGRILDYVLLNNARQCRVVWLSSTQYLLCWGPDTDRTLVDRMGGRLWSCSITSNDSIEYVVALHTWWRPDEATDKAQMFVAPLHRILACGTRIVAIRTSETQGGTPVVAAIEALVSRAPSRRTIDYAAYTTEAKRALEWGNKFHPNVAIVVNAACGVASLADAMRAHQCPKRLVLTMLDEASIRTLAPAIQVTTCLEEITVSVEDHCFWSECYNELFEAIGNNHGLRTLVLKESRILLQDNKEALLELAMRSATLQKIDTRLTSNQTFQIPGKEPRLRAERLAIRLRSNAVVTHFDYSPDVYDPLVMASRVLPILYVNRIRHVLKAECVDGACVTSAAESSSPERVVSMFLTSSFVRSTPEPLYFLLKALFERRALLRGSLSDAATKVGE